MAPTVSILIVTYNSGAVLPPCLDSIVAETHLPYEIILVDNASQDDTVALVHTRCPQSVLIENKQNLGFATAVNQAARVAKGRYLLLLNPDTVVQDNAIERLADFMDKQANVGVAAPYVVDGEGNAAPNSQTIHSVGSLFWRTQFGGPLNRLARKLFTRYATKRSGEEAVFGCALLIRTDLFRHLGGLDERYFLYEEDVDLCYRVLQCGVAIVRVPNVFIVHYGGQSSTLPDIAPEQKMIAASLHRLCSRSLYARKHFSPWKAWVLHLGYAITGVGVLLFGLFTVEQQVRTRRRLIGRHYVQIGWRGLR